MKDLLLIEGLKKKDKVIFDFLFNQYYSALCTFSMHYLNDKSLAEDLVQDFFVKLWFQSNNFKINSSLKAYFFTSVRNRCLDTYKHQKTIERHHNFKAFTELEVDSSFEHFCTETELRQIIGQSLAKLPPRCREIFELSRQKDLTNQEIADKLQISKRTVELQITNALKVLRKELADFLPGWLVILLLQ